MEKLCRAFCLGQESSSSSKINKSCETIEESLQNWKLPPFSASNVYKRSSIFNSSPIETVEVEMPLSEGYTTFHLLSENLKSAYPNKFEYLHIGMIQVGLKPTKLGSNTSAVISLRGKTSKSFHESLSGMVESSLCDGPIYFSYFPSDNSRYISLCKDLSSALCIDIKTEGDENTILMYRLHYRVLREKRPRTRNLSRYYVDKKGETTLFLTNVAQSNRVLSKKICWDEVAVPVKWMEWREYAEAHLLQVDVPAGFEKEKVQVRVETGRIVRITGDSSRPEQAAMKGGVIVRRMRENGTLEEVKVSWVFLRRLRLPENAKLEEVKAVMENGVLTVVVPKEEINEELNEKVVDIMGGVS